MSGTNAKRRMVSFLDRRVFNPILRTSPSRYSGTERKRFETVKRKTETEKNRYHSYGSAAEVRQEYQDDLHSQAARKVNASLKRLHLPILADVKVEFLKLSDDLGIESGQRGSRRKHQPHSPHPWHKKDPKRKTEAWKELRSEARRGDREARKTLAEHSGQTSKRHGSSSSTSKRS